MMQTLDYKAIFENQNNQFVSLYMLSSSVTNLGFGKRFGIWVQGCLKCCKNCIASDSQTINGGMVKSCDELVELILSIRDIDGITISGGEPILQWKALKNIISRVKVKSRHFNVLLFTGYVFENELWPYLNSDSDLFNREFAELFGLLDWWIDGQYEGTKDNGVGLRGSYNQKLYGNIKFPEFDQEIICRQINANEWETLTDKFDIPRGTRLYLRDDKMKDFSTQERLPIWDTNRGQIVGIPTKNQINAFEILHGTNH